MTVAVNRRTFVLAAVPALALAANVTSMSPALSAPEPTRLPLLSADGLDIIGLTPNAKAEPGTLQGRRGLRMLQVPEPDANGRTSQTIFAVVKNAGFEDGTIEVELAGMPRAGAPAVARGFVGIAFRTSPDMSRFEMFYVRPTNGRADDQLLRNHATQYVSSPGFDWPRLRTEAPGVYEAYADMEPGRWMTMKIVVSGTKARLYLNDASQPCLIVNDLKQGRTAGSIALWAGPDSDSYFKNLTVTTAS
ncbi:MAG TPA: hypothetical protein VGU66_07745 [Candidatus Elarobacter sp.]|nr:hypothetical protein [Candidatus Elarobacter sp.]